jgi:hypothetical protein
MPRTRMGLVMLPASVFLACACAMGLLSLAPLAGCAARPAAKQKVRRMTITGTVVETHDYCGGANPLPEMLEALRKGTPVANKTFYVRAGSVNSAKQAVLLQFNTDAQGNFKIALPAGDYCIVEESKKDKSQMPDLAKLNRDLPETQRYELSSPDCLAKWWSACDCHLKVGARNLQNVVITFHRTCNPPCIVGGPQPA